tara:strand:- start:578 stop:1609 length:1032 start_codon:yes stop_codon:yes gene_type:complete
MEILGAGALAGLLAFLTHQIRLNNADAAHYMSFMAAFFFMYDPIKKLGKVADYLAAGEAAGQRLLEIAECEPSIRNAPNAITMAPFNTSVNFENAIFAYDKENILNGFNLTIPRGSLVALVGPSGAGKTTVANLIPRFYDLKGGSLKIDGIDIRELELSSLRKQLSVVSQETFLFNASVSDNISYGSLERSDEDIRNAAKAAYAHDFISALPNGYETIIGERGITLSGGQRQRLAIARALLRNSPLLILDEATSSLDIESERFVQKALETLLHGRTSLVIAHRLSTIRRADHIAVLKNGSIVEEGTHEELLPANGEYARLYKMQFDELDTQSLPYPSEEMARV